MGIGMPTVKTPGSAEIVSENGGFVSSPFGADHGREAAAAEQTRLATISSKLVRKTPMVSPS